MAHHQIYDAQVIHPSLHWASSDQQPTLTGWTIITQSLLHVNRGTAAWTDTMEFLYQYHNLHSSMNMDAQ